MKKDISSLSWAELQDEILNLGLPKFRAKQIFEWLHKYGASDFSEMTNISKSLREQLDDLYFIPDCKIEEKYVSKIDSTVKYLFRLYDGEYVESVIMKYKYGYTICVSSQVGCKMGCRFCASTLAGFKRNLSAGEIEAQLHSAQKDLNIKISHIVMMGIGEPLDNFENVVAFLYNVNSENGLNISMRNITISTCGIVPRIYDLMQLGLPVTLTVSLHAPNDKIRSKTMPVNDKWGISDLIDACKKYADKTGRRVSFEYTLIKGVNDSKECADELSKCLSGMLSHVNLIPVNDVAERGNVRGSRESIIKFQDELKRNKINVTIRRTLGADINASCGQLRRKKNEKTENEVE